MKPLWDSKVSRYVNGEVTKCIGGIGRLVNSYPDIAYGELELFREGGVHLSELGADNVFGHYSRKHQ